MCKKSILKEINSNIYCNMEAWENLYRGKTFAVVAFNGRVKNYYKTKRGAEGFVKRESGCSYYDEMTNSEVNYGSGLEVVEILESDLFNYKENKTIWFKAFLNAMGDEWAVNRVKGLADGVELNEEIREYIEKSFNELKEANFFGGLTVLENKETLTEKLDELKEGLKDYLESESKNDKTISFIKEEIERVENKIKELDPNFESDIIEEVKEENTKVDNFKNKNDISINFNEEKKGIEISFAAKPEKEVLDSLKANGFKWYRGLGKWIAKDTTERREFLNTLTPQEKENVKETESIEVIETVEPKEEIKGIKPTKETIEIMDTLNKNIFIKALMPALNKNDKKEINDKRIKEKSYPLKAKIVEIIKMSKDQYIYFTNNLMDNYEFLKNKGGCELDDNGNYMYHTLIAVVCEGEETLILDPSGYNYVRYLDKLIEGEELIINEVNSLGYNFTIKKESKKVNNRYERMINSIDNTELYVLDFSDEEILNDSRIIMSQSLNRLVLVTGASLKEFIKEGYPIDIFNLEKCSYSIEVLEESLYKEDNKIIFSLFPTKLEKQLSSISMLERLCNELERAKKAV